MKILLLVGIVAMVLFGLGWSYAPEEVRNRVKGVVSSIKSGDGERLSDAILPENPQERRRILIQELKKDVESLRYLSSVEKGDVTREELYEILRDTQPEAMAEEIIQTIENNSGDELIASVQKALEEIDELNEKTSIQHEVGERILDKVLPEGEEIDCAKLCPVE